MRLTRKYKHLFELDILKIYCKLAKADQIKFKDCPFLYYMKKSNYFKDVNKEKILLDTIQEYEIKNWSHREADKKIRYELDLLKIFQGYKHKLSNSHTLTISADWGVIFVHAYFLYECPFLFEMSRNGYFQRGNIGDFLTMPIENIIKIYEDESPSYFTNGDSIFGDDETYKKYYSLSIKYKEFKDVDYWENVFSKIDNELIDIESLVQNDSHSACRLIYKIRNTNKNCLKCYFGSNLNETDALNVFYQSVKQELDTFIKEATKQIIIFEDIKNKLPIVEK